MILKNNFRYFFQNHKKNVAGTQHEPVSQPDIRADSEVCPYNIMCNIFTYSKYCRDTACRVRDLWVSGQTQAACQAESMGRPCANEKGCYF